jgi:beta-barrel assembly-enhancing protease
MDDYQFLENELIRINQTKHGRRAFLSAVPLLLAGCSTTEHRQREGDNKGQDTELTVEGERQLTKEALPQMRKEYPAHRSSYAQSYIESLGQRIVLANGLGGKPYHYNFTVVDVKNVNAFALPAGTVYVTAPLIKMASSEAELAGVVGHEIGHIKARHTAERMHQAKKDQTKNILFGIGGAILGGTAGHFLGKKICAREDKDCLRRIALYGAAAGAGGGLLIQKFAYMANSREDEMEADRIGFRTSYNAGFHKDHVGMFYAKLLEMEKRYKKGSNSLLAPFTDAMSTHPPSRERVVQMREMANNSTAQNGSTITSSSFRKLQKIL